MTPLADAQYIRTLAETLDALPEQVVRYRLPDLTIVYCNAAWATWYHLDPTEVLGRTLDEFLSEDGKAGLAAQLARLGPDNLVVLDTVVRDAPNAPGQWVEWVDRYMPDPSGDEVLAVGRDVTARHLAEARLAESETRFRTLADESTDVMFHFVLAPYPHFDYMSPSVENIVGYPPSFFLDDFSQFLDILSDDDRELIDRAFRGEMLPARSDFHLRHANGSIVVGEMQMRSFDGGIQGVGRDVTELRRLQQSLNDLALRDPLTGLANRRLLKELLDTDLARTQRNGSPLAVAYLDLDDFKIVNDSHGHEAGDIVLCETARRLLAVVRGADIVARLGGDEFVIAYEPKDPSADNLIQRLEKVLSEPILVRIDTSVKCRASIGVADTRTTGYDAGALVAAADAAMYRVKRAHHRESRRAVPAR
ncbi:MAG: diguanylate cyclase [Ilumatobacteraceae bacterium]|nr:diguanylate cyclase [Ilumatobacteraceae bacterium]